MTKKALSRAGLEPAPLGSKGISSELPFILIATFKKKEENKLEENWLLAYQVIPASSSSSISLFNAMGGI